MSFILYIMFLFLKQFYCFPSGSAGIADICLFLSFVFLFAEKFRHVGSCREGSMSPASTFRSGLSLYLFIFCAVALNTAYAVLEHSDEFLQYSLFWIYNGIAIWCFAGLGKKEGFERWTGSTARINILVQSGIWLSGQGRLFYEPFGGTRYMGTFNDPNQLAFFMFVMLLLLYLCGKSHRSKNDLFLYIIGGIVIIASKSTGVSLGALVFIVSSGIFKLSERCHTAKNPVLMRRVLWSGLLIFGLGVIILLIPERGFSMQTERFTLFYRIQEKMARITQNGVKEILTDRVLDKIYLYPQYLLYGAGEGGFSRFPLASRINEIHSSLFSILFCYGILPTILLLLWLRQQMRQMEDWMWPAVFALIIESFFLINYRQPLFWLVLMYGGVRKNQKLSKAAEHG